MLITVHKYPDGATYRSTPLEAVVVEQWVTRARQETGYLGHEYWIEDVDGNVIEYQEHLNGKATRIN